MSNDVDELGFTMGAPPRPEYDPMAFGALCTACPLHGHSRPVPPELVADPILWIAAESPGAQEVLLERPLVGPSGRETMAGLREVGVTRDRVCLTNAVLCPPPGGNLKAYLAQVRHRNKQRKARGLPEYLLPTEACWPRFLQELHETESVLLMGAYARDIVFRKAAAETGGERKLMGSRGFPDEVLLPPIAGRPAKRIKVLSTVHPAFVLRRRRWTKIFRGDVAKAVRMARGRLEYAEPSYLFDPTPEQLASFLAGLAGPVAYDVETDMNGVANTDRSLRCIGIGNAHAVTCIQWTSVERPARQVYSWSEREQITKIINAWFAQDGIVCDHNGQFDRTVMESNVPGFELKRRRFDTCVAHHVVHSEYAHDLGFLSAQFTDAPRHKDVDHDRWDNDHELHHYCMRDVATTARAATILAGTEGLRGQHKAFATDMFMSEFCRQLHKVGMRMDIFERDRWYKKLGEDYVKHTEKARALALKAISKSSTPAKTRLAQEFNPGSPHQLRSLLFDILGIDPVPENAGGITDSGDPAVGKDQLFYLIDQGLPSEIEELLLEIIDAREASKLRGTYCNVDGLDHNQRIHASWNPHVVVSGRLSCSDPNLMNLRKMLRSLYCPQPGNIYVAWDKAQLEARITAVLAGDERQIAAFKEGADIHRVNACDVLGIASVDKVTKDERQFIKTFVYAVQYLASARKAWQMVRNFVNPKTGQRDYRNLTFAEVEALFNRFWEARTAIADFHAGNRALWERVGYLAEVIDGRRRYFLDGGGDESVKEEQANYLIQSAGSADVNRCTRRLVEAFPWGFAGPFSGVVHQCHDSLMVEVPCAMAIEVAKKGQELLYSEINGMPLPVDIGIGYNYRDLVEYAKCPKCGGAGCSHCQSGLMPADQAKRLMAA